MADEGFDHVVVVDVLVVLGHLMQDELGCCLNLVDIQDKTDVHDDQDDVALFEVEVNSPLRPNHSTRCIHDMQRKWVQVLIAGLDRTEYLESELCTVIDIVLFFEVVVQQVAEQLCLSGLWWTHQQQMASLYVLVPGRNHVHFLLAFLVEFDASVASDIRSHF